MSRILSLGWGVQSFTLLAMAERGMIEIDLAVHSDTRHERRATYEFAERWAPRIKTVHIETVASDYTNIGDMENNIFLPAHTTWLNGKVSGLLRRQCTGRWKIDPMSKFLRANGYKVKGQQTTVLLGISVDEAIRMRESRVKWQLHEYPLVDMRMSRADCVGWLQANNFEVPPKSSCVFCPYHSKGEWIRMKERGGDDWQHAVEIDEAIRYRRPKFVSYVPPAHIPLIELKSASDFGAEQLNLWDAECDSGYCFL